MHSLYPAIKPYAQHEIETGSPHILYVEETGNPEGIPVIVLHSGPGAGSDAYLRRFFDPQCYRSSSLINEDAVVLLLIWKLRKIILLFCWMISMQLKIILV